MSIKETKAALAAAKAAYLAVAETGSAAELRAKTEGVKELQAQLSALICEGAAPCPSCGAAPHGLEQPGDRGPTFEVGCTSCGWFLHEDGTFRDHSARGGLLPKHTVEAWNAGPDHWQQPSNRKMADLKARPPKTLAEHRAAKVAK